MFPSGVKHPSILLLNVLHWPGKGPRTIAERDPGGHPIHPGTWEPAWKRPRLLPQAPVRGVEGRGQEGEAQRS